VLDQDDVTCHGPLGRSISAQLCALPRLFDKQFLTSLTILGWKRRFSGLRDRFFDFFVGHHFSASFCIGGMHEKQNAGAGQGAGGFIGHQLVKGQKADGCWVRIVDVKTPE